MRGQAALTPPEAAAHAARLWQLRSTVPPSEAPCSFALLPASGEPVDGYCYVSLGSQLEDLPLQDLEVAQLDGDPVPLPVDDVFRRLAEGHIGVLACRRTGSSTLALPHELISRRTALRQAQSYVKYLVLQIALDEMTDIRGAAEDVLDELVRVWSTPLAVTVDLAVLFTLGADRQRYVTDRYAVDVELRRRALLGYLARRGITSNPLLAV